MSETALTPDRILDAAEETLTRFGPAKTTVVDVARALGVSHGSVYRHFASKAALRDAVTERWLARVAVPLEKIVAKEGPAPQRLRHWFDRLIAIKRQKAKVEPELFATYLAIFAQSHAVVDTHVEHLSAQIAAILADGIARGEFADCDPVATGRAVFHATTRFHDPAYAREWSDPGQDAAFDDLWALILRGLIASPATAGHPGRNRAHAKKGGPARI
jgi:AcrR family transcriptional regulator